jgi:hypothetical protein
MNLMVFNMKKCNKCFIEKEFCDFNKKSDTIDGHHPSCKECRKNLHKLYYESKKTEILKYQKEYYSNNSEKIKNREKNKRKNNPEIYKEYELKRRSTRKEYISKYFIKRRQDDILFKISGNLRGRINKFIKNKSKSTESILGVSFNELNIYLQQKFTEGMSWDNYGEWHIDHIIPLSSAKTEEEIYELCHYTNLQLLWAEDNLKKGCKIL